MKFIVKGVRGDNNYMWYEYGKIDKYYEIICYIKGIIGREFISIFD